MVIFTSGVIMGLLALFRVPFPMVEEVRPKLLVVAGIETESHLSFVSELLRQSVQSNVFDDVKYKTIDGHGKEAPNLIAAVPGASLISGAAEDESGNCPLLLLQVNLPNESETSDARNDRLSRMREAGVFPLTIIESPELRSRVEVVHIDRFAATTRFVIAGFQLNRRLAPGSDIALLRLVRHQHTPGNNISAKLDPSVTAGAHMGGDLEVFDDGTAIRVGIPLEQFGACRSYPESELNAFAQCIVTLNGIEPYALRSVDVDIVAASGLESYISPDAKPPALSPTSSITSRVDALPPARVLFIPSAAFASPVTLRDPAWNEYFRVLMSDAGLLTVDQTSDRAAMYGTSGTPWLYSDVYWPRFQSRTSPSESTAMPQFPDPPGIPQRSLVRELTSDQLHLYRHIIIDLSHPLGLLNSSDYGMQNWVKDLLPQLDSRQHVFLLGAFTQWRRESRVTDPTTEGSKTMGLLADMLRDVEAIGPSSNGASASLENEFRFVDGPPANLVLMYDQTESAGNAQDDVRARLRTLPPSFDHYVPLKRSSLPNALDFELWLGANASQFERAIRSNTADEDDIARAGIERDSKAAFLRSVAFANAYRFGHPLLDTQIQGSRLFNKAWPRNSAHPELDREGELKIEAIERHEMLDFVRRWSVRDSEHLTTTSAPTVFATNSNPPVTFAGFFDHDDDSKEYRSVRTTKKGAFTELIAGPLGWENLKDVRARGTLLGVGIDAGTGTKASKSQLFVERADMNDPPYADAFSSSFLYSGRPRVSRIAAGWIANDLSAFSGQASYKWLIEQFKRMRLPLHQPIADRLCMSSGTSLKICAVPRVDPVVENGRGLGMILGAVSRDDLRSSLGVCPILWAGRSRTGAIYSFCSLDVALESGISAQSFEHMAETFDDWVFSDAEVEDKSALEFASARRRVLRVSGAGSTSSGIAFRLGVFDLKDYAVPRLEGLSKNASLRIVTDSLQLFDEFGSPINAEIPNLVSLTADSASDSAKLLIDFETTTNRNLFNGLAGERSGTQCILGLTIEDVTTSAKFELRLPLGVPAGESRILGYQRGISSVLGLYISLIDAGLELELHKPQVDIDVAAQTVAETATDPQATATPTPSRLRSRFPDSIAFDAEEDDGVHVLRHTTQRMPLEKQSALAAAEWLKTTAKTFSQRSHSRNWLIGSLFCLGLAPILRRRVGNH